MSRPRNLLVGVGRDYSNIPGVIIMWLICLPPFWMSSIYTDAVHTVYFSKIQKSAFHIRCNNKRPFVWSLVFIIKSVVYYWLFYMLGMKSFYSIHICSAMLEFSDMPVCTVAVSHLNQCWCQSFYWCAPIHFILKNFILEH